MVDALRAELFKLSRRRMTYILLLVGVATVALFYVTLWLRVRQGPGSTTEEHLRWLTLRDAMSFRNVIPYGLALERFFVTIVCVIFSGTMVGNEFDWRTVGVVTSRGVKRWHFLSAKLVVSLGFSFIAIVLCFAMAVALSAWFGNLYKLPSGELTFVRLADALLSMGRTWFAVLPFVLMAFFLGVQLRSAGQAVGATLGIYFIEGIFLGLLSNATGFLSYIPDALFNVNIDAVMRANGLLSGQEGGGPFGIGSAGPPAWRGFAILFAWIVAFALAAFWRFHRRDIQE